jgi:hypothetical protein
MIIDIHRHTLFVFKEIFQEFILMIVVMQENYSQ